MILCIRLFLSGLFLSKVTPYDAATDCAKHGMVASHMTGHSTNGRTFEATGRVYGTTEQSERQDGKCKKCFHSFLSYGIRDTGARQGSCRLIYAANG